MPHSTTESFVLDTSAVVALTDDEPGADTVERLLRQGGKIELRLSTVTLMELYYVAIRKHGTGAAARLIATVKAWPVTWVEPTERILLQAGRLKADYRLSFADAIIAATAKLVGATLVHKDPEFLALAPELAQRELPFKPQRSTPTTADDAGRRGS
jgi:predicted nucleic acid-binding protein